MSRLTIEERARRYLDKIPGAISGSGGHDQTYTAACSLVKGFDLSIDEARPLMRVYNERCQPPWSESQLEHKLTSADRSADTQPRGWLLGDDGAAPDQPRPRKAAPAPAAPKTVFQPAKLAAFSANWRDKVSLLWLADRSPIEPALVGPADFLESLYTSENDKVLIFNDQASQGQALWPHTLDIPTGDDGIWFLAQPVDGKKHPNPRTGKFSRRSEESVTDWRYLVVESDEASRRDWLGALVQLPLQIAAIYTSGGRSIHALVRVDAGSKAEWDRERDALKEPLIILGADPKSLSAVRLTRLPGCWRGNRFQKLLYLNPTPAAVPICEQPVLRQAAQRWLAAHFSLMGVIDTADDERAPAGLLAALEFYAAAHQPCATAAAHWRNRHASPPPVHEQSQTAPE